MSSSLQFESFFGYNVTRKYPYRWFTWLVMIGGVVATIILSVINLAANGYEPSLQTVLNPNETESPSHPAWFQKKPWSQLSKVTATCQDQELSVGSKFYTSNFAFPYQISGISRNGTDPSASCTYHNDFLHECHVIAITLLPHPESDLLDSGIDATASINCTLYEASEPIFLLLDLSVFISHEFGIIIDPNLDTTNLPLFISSNGTAQAGLQWGRVMIYMNAVITESDFNSYQYQSAVRSSSDDIQYSTGFNVQVIFSSRKFQSVCFEPNAGAFGQPNEQLATAWNNAWTSTFGMDTLLLNQAWNVGGVNWFEEWIDIRNISDTVIFSSVMLDNLAKSLYFTILTDLGQKNLNVFSSPQQTMEFYNRTCQLKRANPDAGGFECYGAPYTSNMTAEDLLGSYNMLNMSQPFVRPATIPMQYLCQVPKLKSTGSLLVSIIVADVVFLQVLWFLLNLITTFIVERQDPTATHCSGCVAAEETTRALLSDTDLERGTEGGEDTSTSTMEVDTEYDTASQASIGRSNNNKPYEPLPMVISRSASEISLSTTLLERMDQNLSHPVRNLDHIQAEAVLSSVSRNTSIDHGRVEHV